VGVEPEDTAWAVERCERTDRPERDGMVAAEDERRQSALRRHAHSLGDPLARRADLREVARVLRSGIRRLADLRLDVAQVMRDDRERGQAFAQTGVADRRRAHIDPAAAGAEIELGANDRDPPPVGHRAILTDGTYAPID
jgi:hypothetical protein